MFRKRRAARLLSVALIASMLLGSTVFAETLSGDEYKVAADEEETDTDKVTAAKTGETEEASEDADDTKETEATEDSEDTSDDDAGITVTEEGDVVVTENAAKLQEELTVSDDGTVEEEEDPLTESDAYSEETDESYDATLKIVNLRANAKGTALSSYVSYTEYLTGKTGYVYGGSGADAAYLGKTSDGKVKFMIAGVVGLVDSSKVQVMKLTNAESFSCYYANGKNILHRISTDMTTPGYATSINVGPQQSYMKKGTTYYSYDGHYFYKSYATMIADYKKDTRANAINPNNPYYNYYQYLPLRGTSGYSAAEFKAILNTKVSSSSAMYNLGDNFVTYQNKYGVNALIIAGIAALESGWGTSNYALKKNNLFGIAAYDENPDNSTTFASAAACVKYMMGSLISKNYLYPESDVYCGGYLGDKASGINVKYCSSPYWGEKIASICWAFDAAGDNRDANNYTLGIKDDLNTSHHSLSVRRKALSSSVVLYQTRADSNYSFIILDSEDGYYKIQSDAVLTTNRASITSSTGEYDASSMYAYLKISDVEDTGMSWEAEDPDIDNDPEYNPDEDDTSSKGVILSSEVNMRSGAGTENAVVATLGTKQIVDVLGSSGSWYHISVTINGEVLDGYVYSSYVAPASKIPAKPTLKVTATSFDRNVLKWSKVSGATGYQVQRYNPSTKKYVTIRTITTGTTISYTDKGLKTGKSYKYRVRAYRTVKGYKLYGSFSKVITSKTKSYVIGKINARGVNVRSKASLKASVLKVLAKGTKIKVTGRLTGWYKVRVTVKSKARTGYIKKTYITL